MNALIGFVLLPYSIPYPRKKSNAARGGFPLTFVLSGCIIKEKVHGVNIVQERLEEQLITAWVRLTGILKNTRITKGMVYNEAIVMLVAYHRYCEGGDGRVSFKEIVTETRMLKSLVNRTIDSLVEQGYLERSEGKDKRTTFVRIVPEHLEGYLAVHERSLALARELTQIIGEEDAHAFVRIVEKLVAHHQEKTQK